MSSKTSKLFDSSDQSEAYAKYRPLPPSVLINAVLDFLRQRKEPSWNGKWKSAVDVGCGTGQCTNLLSPYFEQVRGFDVSKTQIEAANGNKPSNVCYAVSAAETIPVEDGSVDLITACQSFHWFDEEKFYKEVDRVLSDNGVLAVFGYLRPTLHPLEDNVHFMDKTKLKGLLQNTFHGPLLAPYNAQEHLAVVESGYIDVILPYVDFTRFDSITTERELTLEDLCGYIKSWSGYANCKKRDPETARKVLQEFAKSYISLVQGNHMSAKVKAIYNFVLLLTRKPPIN